jgi:hypothetical protein
MPVGVYNHKPHSESTKEKMRNKIITEEMREKIHIARAKQVMKPRSNETKEKLRLAKIKISKSWKEMEKRDKAKNVGE